MMKTDRSFQSGPLAGLRILDLSRLLPGPYCSLLLAGMGAEVIKVETPLAGDYARMAPAELGFGGVFEALNRGKRSVAIDYRKPVGRDLVLELVSSADVFIESSRPGRLDRYGLGAIDTRGRNPRLVHCSISGYGQIGPYRDKPGHDIDYLAVAGTLSVLGTPGAAPMPPALQVADIATGNTAAVRILAALLGRATSGFGAYLDVAATDGPMSWIQTLGDALDWAGTAAGPMCGAYPCYGTYRASDGRWLAVGALEVPFWQAFCSGLGQEDLIPRQFDPTAIDIVAREIAAHPSGWWLERLADDACVELVRTPAEAAADPYLRLRSSDLADQPAPVLGADTAEVLAEAGIDHARLDRLTASGVVAGVQSPARTARAARLGAMLARRKSAAVARTA